MVVPTRTAREGSTTRNGPNAAIALGARARKDEKVAKDSKTGPTREMLSAVAASVAKLHALDATAVDAAVAGLPEDQRTALASLAAGF